MEEWLHPVTKDTLVIIDAMALIIVATRTAAAFFTGLWAAFAAPATHRRVREVWLRYDRDLAELLDRDAEFQPTAPEPGR
jgi:hypothetical protein